MVAHGTAARYLTSGHLLMARGGSLFVVPFDAERLETTGAPVQVADGVMQSALGAAQFSVSRTGTVGTCRAVPVTRIDMGVSVRRDAPLATPPQTYWSVRLSPDGHRLALGVEAATYGVWIYDLERGTLRARPSRVPPPIRSGHLTAAALPSTRRRLAAC